MKKKLTLFNIALALIILTIILLIFLVLFMKPPKSSIKKKDGLKDSIGNQLSPVFRKDGELVFSLENRDAKEIRIDIEIADDPAEREQGLMYRDSMPEMSGMLFLFTEEEPLNFWMKNTRIPLDIIYVNSDRRVVSIARNTTPFSLDQIPSVKPALYVVEVNAGFSDRHGIKEGVRVVF